MTRNGCAIVYVAWGAPDYAHEAARSAHSVRRHMPDIAIYLKLADPGHSAGLDATPFDAVQRVEAPPAGPIVKARFLDGVTESRVLYLDTDTYVCGDLSPIFALLDRFDMAAAHAPIRSWFPGGQPEIPATFPDLNGGVIAVRNAPRIHALLAQWQTCYEALRPISRQDQPSLRQAVWQSDVSLCVLPPEWNARLSFPTYVADPVRLIHARFADMERAARKANRASGPRVLLPPRFLSLAAGWQWRVVDLVRRHRLRRRAIRWWQRLRGRQD